MTTISRHAKRRLSQRVCKNRKLHSFLVSDAFRNGQSYKQLTGWLRSYVIRTYKMKRTADNIRVHNDRVWLFAGSHLITVWPLPKYRKQAFSAKIHRLNIRRQRRNDKQKLHVMRMVA